MIHEEILNKSQKEVLEKLKFLPQGTYLAGGTALAFYLGHRTSLDFDFYLPRHFEPSIIVKDFQNHFSKVTVERAVKDTIILEVEGVSISLFFYPYNLIAPLTSFKNIRIASLEDIAAMKMVAIASRGKRRDFIDVYYLLQMFSLDEIIKLTLKKYPSYQPMVILKGLIYFKDAEEKDMVRGIKVFDKGFNWEKTKQKIFREVSKYQLSKIEK